MQGEKAGWSHVVWTSSTWNGKPTVHDRTVTHTRTVRDMAGTMDVFENEDVSDCERGEDGTWWETKSVEREAGGRETTTVIRWTGDGYDLVRTLNGVEEKKRVDVAAPVPLEAEPVLGRRIRDGTLAVGAKVDLPVLDFQAGKVKTQTIEVVAREDVEGESGKVPCFKVVQRDPETHSEFALWIDEHGSYARSKGPLEERRRVGEAAAKRLPARPARFSITARMSPPVERIFSAERTLVDVRLKGDPSRPLPEIPDSPWSRVTSVDGDDERGWTLHAELRAYDAPKAAARIPVTDPAFAKDLESTVLLCTKHPKVVEKAKEVVGGETDARKAAQRIADFVFGLTKESSEVGEMTAVEILDRMQGDCSEHATLFVALCRAAGIPARRCSGWVCVGSLWGGHAWAEIWVGQWIGADPTTDDVGTAARYLFFGRDDDPTTHAGVVSERIRGRIELSVTHVDEGDDHVDLTDEASLKRIDRDAGTASQKLVGLELRGMPKDWSVSWRDSTGGVVRGPGLFARIHVMADQGYRDLTRSEGDEVKRATFGGAPALVSGEGSQRTVQVASRKRRVRIDLMLTGSDPDATFAQFEKAIAPSFAERPGK
jgi:transglutaminase-like putative cysteine protease